MDYKIICQMTQSNDLSLTHQSLSLMKNSLPPVGGNTLRAFPGLEEEVSMQIPRLAWSSWSHYVTTYQLVITGGRAAVMAELLIIAFTWISSFIA